MTPTRMRARALTTIALATLAVALPAGSALALPDEWTRIGPLGGAVSAMAVHPTNFLDIYAPTGGVLYHTTDGGASWATVVSCPTGVSGLWMVRSAPDTLFVIANTYRFYASTDAGNSWTELAAGALCFAYDRGDPRRMFIGGGGGLVRKSVDGGVTWTPHPTGSLNPIVAIAISPGDSNTVYVAGQGDGDFPGFGILKTTDGGATWQDADAGLPWADVGAIYIDPVNADTLFAQTTGCCMYWGEGLFRSIDGGGSWSPVNAGLPCWSCPYDVSISDLEAIPGEQGSYYALSHGETFRSDDGGVTWSEEATGIEDDVLSLEFWAQEQAIRLFGAGYGIWRKTPWSAERFGIVPIAQSGIAVDPFDTDILYTIGDIAYKSVDGGATWSLLRNGATWATGTAIAINPQNPDILYVADYQGPSEVYRTLDGGASWDTSLALATDDIQIDPADPDIVYAAGSSGLFRTLDGGDSWSRIEVDRAVSIAINPRNDSTIYIGTASYGIRKSTDFGLTWTPMNDGLPADLSGKFFLALAVDPSHPDTLYCGGAGSIGIYKSANGGLDWLPANDGLASLDVRKIVVDPARPSILYAQGGYGAVHRSIDGARSWELLNPALETGWFAHDIALDPLHPNVIYFCCDTGLYRCESSWDPSTGAGAPPVAALDIASYPNPFSGSATVEYVLARGGAVRLAVYDVAGRRVAVLAEGPRAAGRHTASLEGRGLGPGVYFIRGSIDGRAFVRKCVLVR